VSPLDVSDDDGFVTLRVTDDKGVTAEVRADVYELHDRLVQFQSKAESGDAYFAALAEYLSSQGLPAMSRRGMAKLVRAVYARVAELRGKDQARASSGSPDSAGSSGSGAGH
jgi:hypothetical protein